MKTKPALIIVIALMVGLVGCSSLQSRYEKPEVHLTQIKPRQSENGSPGFTIGVRVLNPNRQALDISGVYFTLRLQGYQVVSGISNQSVHIESYGEGNIELNASASLFEALRTLVSVMDNPEQPVTYTLETRIETGFWRFPVTAMDSGTLNPGAILKHDN